MTTTVIVEAMLMMSRISMLVTHHSGDDCQDCDDEESSHVSLFPVVVSYTCIISSGCRFVKPNQGFFLFPYIYYRHFSPPAATLSATFSQILQK